MIRVGTSREANHKSATTGMSSEDDRAVVAVFPQFSDQIGNVVFQLTDVFDAHVMAARLIATMKILQSDFCRTDALTAQWRQARPAAGKNNNLVMSGS
jgi:hypothetical protein